jgi:hypothetical protein
VTDSPARASALEIEEDGAVRRWLAARTMRTPLVVLKFGSPVLVIATLAVVVRTPNLAAQPLDVLYLLALPFAVPFIVAMIYPLVRWTPQRWTLDVSGIHGRGRVRVDCPWSEIVWWGSAALARLPGYTCIACARGTTRTRVTRIFVAEEARAAVAAWVRRVAPSAEERTLPPID